MVIWVEKNSAGPLFFPPWQVKASTFTCHEYANNLCLLEGWEKLGRPILSPPWQDKASTWCRWLSGWRKTRLVRYFSTLTSESINLTLSWICKQPLLFRGWRKTGPAHSFPNPTSESINLTLSWICKQPLLFRGWGKTGSAHSFPTLTSESINLVQKLGYLGGEKLGLPILSPPRQDKASTWCRWLSGWRKTRLVRYFPTLTSESINLTLSWIHIQPLLSRGWGKNWAGPFFPHPD